MSKPRPATVARRVAKMLEQGLCKVEEAPLAGFASPANFGPEDAAFLKEWEVPGPLLKRLDRVILDLTNVRKFLSRRRK